MPLTLSCSSTRILLRSRWRRLIPTSAGIRLPHPLVVTSNHFSRRGPFVSRNVCAASCPVASLIASLTVTSASLKSCGTTHVTAFFGDTVIPAGPISTLNLTPPFFDFTTERRQAVAMELSRFRVGDKELLGGCRDTRLLAGKC
jgi:hypothetical protein